MVRFFFLGVLAVVLCGCEAPMKPSAEPNPMGGQGAIKEGLPEERGSETPVMKEAQEPEEGSLASYGLIPAEPVMGINHPMPMDKYEIQGVGDDLEKLILSDFKKDLKLYGIYEFPSDSGKPEVVYVFTRTNDGHGYAVPDEEVSVHVGPIVYKYDGLADKMSGANKVVNLTRKGGSISYPGRTISYYNGDIAADYTLSWSWVSLEEGPLTSELIILKRSKGEFKSEVIEKAQEIWFNGAMSEWRNLTSPGKEKQS